MSELNIPEHKPDQVFDNEDLLSIHSSYLPNSDILIQIFYFCLGRPRIYLEVVLRR